MYLLFNSNLYLFIYLSFDTEFILNYYQLKWLIDQLIKKPL